MSYALSAPEYTADRGSTYVGTDYWMKDPGDSSAPSASDDSTAAEAPAPSGGGSPSSSASPGDAPGAGVGSTGWIVIGALAVAAAYYALS